MINTCRIENKTRNSILARKAGRAVNLTSRLKGLIGRKALENGEALIIPKCRAVHTFFMKFPVDIIFIDSSCRVVKTARGLKPFRLTACFFRTSSVIELPAGTIKDTNTKIKDCLHINPGLD